MYCYKCGKQLIPEANFCSACGAQREKSTYDTQQLYYPTATQGYDSPQPQLQQQKSLWACYVLSWKTWTTEGRATRREYWGAYLFNMLFSLAWIILMVALYEASDPPIGGFFVLLMIIYLFAMSISSIFLTVRRLHDIGRSGMYYFVSFIPYVGPIILLIWMCTESKNDPSNPWHQPYKNVTYCS